MWVEGDMGGGVEIAPAYPLASLREKLWSRPHLARCLDSSWGPAGEGGGLSRTLRRQGLDSLLWVLYEP